MEKESLWNAILACTVLENKKFLCLVQIQNSVLAYFLSNTILFMKCFRPNLDPRANYKEWTNVITGMSTQNILYNAIGQIYILILQCCFCGKIQFYLYQIKWLFPDV